MLRASLLTLALVTLAAGALVACSGSSDSGTSSSTAPTTPGTGSSSGGAGSSEKPVYQISCHGDVAKKSVDVVLGTSPQCKPNDVGCTDKCKAQDVSFWYEAPAFRCGSTDIYEWNGEACVAHSTAGEGGSLRCKGNDCEKVFKSKADCDAFAAPCLAK
jgi:hypothetical protein